MGDLQQLVIVAVPIIFAITVHEVAHGWVARQLGDPTAMMMGRLTLNPIKHMDPVGTLLVPGLLWFSSGMIFGWAKPVPVNWENLRSPKRDMALVALAGPGANLIMAFGWAVVAKIAASFYTGGSGVAAAFYFMGGVGISANGVLMVLNLLPLPPLDGGRVLTGVLPNHLALKVARIEPYGIIILMVLLLTGQLQKILLPALDLVRSALGWLVGL